MFRQSRPFHVTKIPHFSEQFSALPISKHSTTERQLLRHLLEFPDHAAMMQCTSHSILVTFMLLVSTPLAALKLNVNLARCYLSMLRNSTQTRSLARQLILFIALWASEGC